MGQLFLGIRNPKEVSLKRLQEEVGPGWAGVIERLTTDLFALGWDGVVLQAKEKFGGLRFYIANDSDLIHARINAAESESYKTCEQCGAAGLPRQDGWIKTLCDEHAKGRAVHEDLV